MKDRLFASAWNYWNQAHDVGVVMEKKRLIDDRIFVDNNYIILLV